MSNDRKTAEQITITIPEDATSQILNTLLKSTKAVNGSSAYEVLDLVRSWRQDAAPRFEIRTDHNAAGTPTLVIWDTQTDRVALNPAGYREEYLLPENAEAMCAYLNLTPEEQAAIHAEDVRQAQAEHQKCICGHGMVSHGTADRHCTMCVVNGDLGCLTFRGVDEHQAVSCLDCEQLPPAERLVPVISVPGTGRQVCLQHAAERSCEHDYRLTDSCPVCP